MQVYEIMACFFIYGFLGWSIEVAYAAVRQKKFVNRGFLNGPICPIYGVGVTAVVLLAAPFTDRLLLLYVFSAVLVTALELVTGLLLDKLFHHKWWDYSDRPLNIGGYVCLPFSLIWGLACLAIVKGIQPFLERFLHWLPAALVVITVVVLTGILLADVIVTYRTVLHLNRQLAAIKRVAGELHELSDKIGENIYERVRDTLELKDKLARATNEQKERALKLGEEYRRLLGENVRQNRILKAFPKLSSKKYSEALEELKQRLKNWQNGN